MLKREKERERRCMSVAATIAIVNNTDLVGAA
jgi:hypothetical protein